MQFLKKYKELIIGIVALAVFAVAFYYFVWKVDIKQETVKNNNVQAFLKAIRFAEGTDGARGYNTVFGYTYFDSFADHPHQRKYFTDLTGHRNWTDAAGAYQMISTTWATAKQRLSLPDFSPASQDKAAIFIIDKWCHALEDVVAGRFAQAIEKCSTQWASLPASKANQPKKTLAQVAAIYKQNGGALIA